MTISLDSANIGSGTRDCTADAARTICSAAFLYICSTRRCSRLIPASRQYQRTRSSTASSVTRTCPSFTPVSRFTAGSMYCRMIFSFSFHT